jgi:Na+/melibiose symporter-like transporter
LAERVGKRPNGPRIGGITKRRIFCGLAGMVTLLVVGTIVGVIWADTSDAAGAFAAVTNIVGAVGVVSLLIALAVVTRRQRQG